MKLYITPRMQRILAKMVYATDREWSAMGKIEILDNAARLVDLKIPLQESTRGATEFTDEGLFNFFDELEADNENPKDWRCWIHSHNTMGAFWSPTDTSQMKTFDNGGPDFFFHLVVSTTGQKAAFSSYKPFKYENLDIPVFFEAEDETNTAFTEVSQKIEQLEKLYKEKLIELQAEKEESLFLPYAEEIERVLALLEERNKEPVVSRFITPSQRWGGNQKKKNLPIPFWLKENEDEEENEEEEGEEEDNYGDLEGGSFTRGYFINNHFISYGKYIELCNSTSDHTEFCACDDCQTIDQYYIRSFDADK